MKKTLIAMAVLAASGASFAQVTLYGAVSTAYKNQKTTAVFQGAGTDTRADGFTNGEVNGSDRWGMKGVEDLGGGMKATFQLESALNTADGTGGTALFNRQSTVGLEGGFGALRFGRSTTPVHDALAATDVMEIQALTTTNLNPVSRVSNAVFYATPNTFGGFYANAVYGMSDAGSSGAGGVPNLTKSQGLSLGYKAGPLHVVGAMVVLDTTVVASVDGKTDGQVIGLTYDFGAAKLFVNSSRGQVQANVGIDTKTVNTETNLGLSVPVGAFTFLAGLGRNARTATVAGAETAATGTSTANVSGTGSGADWVLGVYYSLSKRTNVFVKTGTINKFDFGSTVASPNTANRLETSGTAIGLRHTF